MLINILLKILKKLFFIDYIKQNKIKKLFKKN